MTTTPKHRADTTPATVLAETTTALADAARALLGLSPREPAARHRASVEDAHVRRYLADHGIALAGA